MYFRFFFRSTAKFDWIRKTKVIIQDIDYHLKKRFNITNYYTIMMWQRVYLDTAKNWKHYSKIIFKYMNNTMRPFLIKKLLKCEVCGSREQFTGSTGMHRSSEKVNNHG